MQYIEHAVGKNKLSRQSRASCGQFARLAKFRFKINCHKIILLASESVADVRRLDLMSDMVQSIHCQRDTLAITASDYGITSLHAHSGSH
jgi:hypothetical protein